MSLAAALASVVCSGTACVVLAGCAMPAPIAAPPRPLEIAAVLPLPVAPDARLAGIGEPPATGEETVAAPPSSPHPAPALRLTLDARRMPLPPGRSVVTVEVVAGELVSIAVFGPVDALLGFDLVPSPLTARVRAHGPLDEDGKLPRVVSLVAPGEGMTEVGVVIDVTSPVEIARVGARADAGPAPSFNDLKRGRAEPRTLVGLPAPRARDDGYLLQSPGRYQFVRVDVARALLAAFRQTRVRFRRDPIAIADVSQWDGVRPATDLGLPRHISHEGGRDVDLALPADDGEPSTVRVHCTGVLVEADVYGCAPGTAKGVDALRLAYLLGLLIDGAPGRVEKIFIDEQYMRELRKAAIVLRERRWIKDDGFAGLSEDGLVRVSPWHTDHVHVRFSGEPARSPW